MHAAISDAFKYSKLALATTTYNASIFPYMRTYINHLTERSYQNRTVALIENGSWAPMANKIMKSLFEKSKGITFAQTEVKIMSALNEESLAQINALVEELA
jgi:flavorubredoxin